MATLPFASRMAASPSVRKATLLAGLSALASLCIPIGLAVYRRRRLIYGNARLATLTDAADFGLRRRRGVVLGRQRGRLLIDDSDRHVLVIGSPGQGKSRSLVIPSIMRFGGSMFILDFGGELHREMSGWLGAMLSAIAPHERFVILQDTLELEPSQENVVLLTASKGGQGSARVTMTSLLAAALRLRPDRIFMGEIRGEEAFDFLNAINTGHPGSMTTIHANSPRHAFDRLSTLVLNSGIRMDRADIIGYIRSIVPIVVQLTKGGEHGARGVSEIFFADEVDCHGKRKHA